MALMESGLEGRNNTGIALLARAWGERLNEVRPRRPEQFRGGPGATPLRHRLNEVRPSRPEQSGFLIDHTNVNVLSQ